MGVLSNLEPKEVFYYFEELTKIPHGSFNTKQISDFCVNFAKEHGLKWYQDDANNVIIIKEATPGYEDAPVVMLQGHMDMVCAKEPGLDFDFKKDSLNLQIDGDIISAKGTTLGGDDGAAVAYCLALLASKDIPHPKLEVILTIDEEVGMLGAQVIDLSPLEGKILINIDSEEEGIFLTSCAGGLRANLELPVGRVLGEGIEYEVSLEGMTGGHSGMEINKGRGNSNKLMGRILYTVNKEAEVKIVDMEGGEADNAIARKTVARVLVDEAQCEAFEKAVRDVEAVIRHEQRVADPGLKIVLTRKEKIREDVLDRESKRHLFMVLLFIPDGVQNMSMELEGLVETSLNLGVLKLEKDKLLLSSAVRSSVSTAKDFLTERLKALIECNGGSMSVHGDYPAWEFQKDSYIREVFVDAYKALYGEEPKIEAIHAGLECGLLSNKVEGLDCISLGPDMSGVHTPDEKLSISSTERTWKLLLEALKRLKK